MGSRSSVIIGKYIKKLRLNQGLSIEKLASRTEISASQISVIERGINTNNGKYINISLTSLELIALGLNITVQQIFEDSGYYDFINIQLIEKQNAILYNTMTTPDKFDLLNEENKHIVSAYVNHLLLEQEEHNEAKMPIEEIQVG